jgi:uracil-DNA glycosylase
MKCWLSVTCCVAQPPNECAISTYRTLGTGTARNRTKAPRVYSAGTPPCHREKDRGEGHAAEHSDIKIFRALGRAAGTIALMSGAYHQLLDAAIQHLEELKAQGVQFVPVTPETLAALTPSRRLAHTREQVTPPASTPSPAPPPVSRPAPPSVKPAEAKLPVEPAFSLAVPGETPAAAPAAVVSPEAKAAAFAELRERAMVCRKCPHLASSRKNVVFGVGSLEAELMFIGEAPGADEDKQGEPFVGKAGQLLTRIIQAMGLTRDTVYIGNILKCRPDTPGQAAGNRKPTPDEMKTCIPYLHEQIDLIRPKVIVALGATAVEGLLGKTIGITRLRGNWKTYRGIPLMPTYHPAYLLRNQAPSEKRRVWEDMLQVMGRLGLPISEKQRNYFLKGG